MEYTIPERKMKDTMSDFPIEPVIQEVPYSRQGLDTLSAIEDAQSNKLLLEYPTLYIVNDKKKQKYTVYVGETNDINRRTMQHLQADGSSREDWHELNESKTSQMFVVGHPLFNKSLTLDIENKMMLYLSSVDAVEHINNRRTNEQNQYYTSDKLNQVFGDVWRELRKNNQELFPLLEQLQDSAIFKASPFHKLTREQFKAKHLIQEKIEEAINRDKKGQLIFVEGEAGSGKTVLLSSLFYDVWKDEGEASENTILRGRNAYLLVNHDQQIAVYKEVAKKLGIPDDMVKKPTQYIEKYRNQETKELYDTTPADVILVDEGHLMLTRGKQSYRGSNHLDDLLALARVVVVIFDPKQILNAEQYIDQHKLLEMKHDAIQDKRMISLKGQMRIAASDETIDWIRNLVDEGIVAKIPSDDSYDLRVFDSPQALFDAIVEKNGNSDNGLSRIVATYDWPYKGNDKENQYYVEIGDFKKLWNMQLTPSKQQKKLSWAEQNQTIDEIGSTFTIQGFDLNYVGVIIGKSVIYRDGLIQFDGDASFNKTAKQKNLVNGQRVSFINDFLRNELNVLLTRGVHGLYIYAVDSELQEALQKAQEKGELL
jgi:DUF2075 family protein/predicted GIY-YIG superfamily endonuclease